jgi:ribonuclease-3
MLGFCPNDITLFQQACRHRSMGRNNQERGNNERLEFLGDAVLSAIASDIIYKTFNNKDEGFLSKTRSKIVQRETLNHVALKLGLDKIVEITIHSQSHNNNTYGNALEALIGAIYLDQGYDICRKIVEEKIILKHIDIKKIS